MRKRRLAKSSIVRSRYSHGRARKGLFGLVCVLVLGATLTFGASVASAGVTSVTLAGSGTGTVTSSPVGIECSNVPGAEKTECSYDFGFNFNPGTLTATPAPGSAFLSWSGTGGGTCTGPTNPCTTATLVVEHAVTATFAPAPEPPTVTTGVASDVEFPSAKVAGTVNPDNDDFPISDCYFEWGTTTAYGEKFACAPKLVGTTGTSPVAVSASIGVLDPGKTYHYRLVAANGGGTRFGEDRTFIAGAAPADNCPNAAIRAEQGALAQRLPNCGAYELVSPPFTGGQAAIGYPGTADGNVATLFAAGGFAGVENLRDTQVYYRSERTDSGWKTSAVTPPGSQFPYLQTMLDSTQDPGRNLWFANLKADEGTQRFTPIVRDPDGSFHLAGLTQDEPNPPPASSADLSMVVQSTKTRLALTDGTVDTRSTSARSLYASTYGPDGQLSVRQVAYRAGATMFPECEAQLGGVSPGFGSSLYSRNSVSADGSRIFFTSGFSTIFGIQQSCDAPEWRRVWAKVGDADPIDLSASQCPATCGAPAGAYFRGASRDGSRVYFTTEQQLLPEDQDSSHKNDLYEYDFDATGQKLRLVTGSAEPEGAGVSVSSVFRVSPDGAYVYFVATGRPLAGENARGASPQPGANNLYVYHRAAGQANATMTFVGALGSSFNEHPQLSSTGRFLLFLSTADLTGERLPGDTQMDLYRYDADEDELLRIWTDDPAHNGTARISGPFLAEGLDGVNGNPSGGTQMGGAGEWQRNLQISADGSMVGFTTAEPLSVDDHNTTTDAYLWQAETGQLTLLTGGSSKPGSRLQVPQFIGMTPSGDSLFVTSATPLLKSHTNGLIAAYVIRKDGGFPGQGLPDEPCTGDACQGSPATPPAESSIGSADFSGPGNPPSASVSIAKHKAAVGATAKLRVRVPAAGRISVSGAKVRKSGRSVARARTVTVNVSLKPKAKKELKKKQKLKVKVRVAFNSRAGDSASKTVTIVFKQPKANKKGDR